VCYDNIKQASTDHAESNGPGQPVDQFGRELHAGRARVGGYQGFALDVSGQHAHRQFIPAHVYRFVFQAYRALKTIRKHVISIILSLLITRLGEIIRFSHRLSWPNFCNRVNTWIKSK